MPRPPLDACAVVIPVKAFWAAKQRLAPVLAAPERAVLARRLATVVVRAAGALPVLVVCDDDEVAAWAEDQGATVVWAPARGLDGAVVDGVAAAAASGAARAIVAHADLPLARDLAALLDVGTAVVLVPDRRRDGTNVALVPTGASFAFAYGPGSFDRHTAEAARLGLPCSTLEVAGLAWDVDVPADLDHDAVTALLAAPDAAGRAAPVGDRG